MFSSSVVKMDKLQRVLVYVAKDRSSPHQKVNFLQSVVGLLGDGAGDELEVNWRLDKNHFIMYTDKTQVPLKRPSFCPIKHLSVSEAAAIPLDVRERGVDVGVAILLQSSNQRLLLTRRASHLRIFPNVWVPPGGHLEPGETLMEAGLRELKEETGLSMDPDNISTKVLGLWESVFPLMLSRGLPHRHHIVVYVLVQTPLSHQQLQEHLSPSPQEVSACLWAEPQLITTMVSEEEHSKEPVSVYAVSPNGSLVCSLMPASVLTASAPTQGPDVERVSTGTIYALGLWLKHVTNSVKL